MLSKPRLPMFPLLLFMCFVHESLHDYYCEGLWINEWLILRRVSVLESWLWLPWALTEILRKRGSSFFPCLTKPTNIIGLVFVSSTRWWEKGFKVLNSPCYVSSLLSILVKSIILIPDWTNYCLVHLKQLRNRSLSMGFTCLHYLLSIVNRIAGILFYPCRVV